jgi:cytochrome c-type protein NapB
MEVVMKKVLLTAAAGALLARASAFAVGAADVVSLRGDNPINAPDKAFETSKLSVSDGVMTRDWKQQPPIIPHKIDRDEITLQVNTCLRCHSEENYKTEKAPRIGDSHYMGADGKKLTKIDMRRHFCTQCHVPQQDAKPLVENTFKGFGACKGAEECGGVTAGK